MKQEKWVFHPLFKRTLISASLAILATGNGWAESTKSSTEKVTIVENVQQTRKITGTVTDEKGEAIIGANVMVKETTTGVITDLDGHFTLEVPKNSTLQISYIGYTSQELKVMNQSTLNIVLIEDSKSLDEVVVVGYGTQRKGSVATSITSIKGETLRNRATPTIGEALQGQVAGLTVVGNSQPGKTPSIQLRGATSLNSGGSPLVLVDGVPSDFNYLNMEDVESINVLKDAASAAIYGSRAANGVILVTTKRGQSGKANFRYTGSIGVHTPTALPKTCSSAVYARAINEAERNVNRAEIYSSEDIALYESGADPNRYPNTDWLGLAIKNSLTTRHGIEASGGSDKVKYLVSGGLDHQTGVFPQTSQNVFNVRSNTDIAISKKVNLSFDMRYQLRNLDELLNVEDTYGRLVGMEPNKVAYYTDGSYGYNPGFFINPLVDLYEAGNKKYDRHDASGIMKLDYEIIDGLKLTGIANVNYVFGNTTSRSRELHYKDFFTQQEYKALQNGLTEKREYKAYYNLQALLNYKKTFGKHSVDGLIGYQQENEKSNWISAGRSGYPTDLLWVLNGGPKDNWNNDGNAEHWAIASVIGRLNYDYANKYILSASFRSDASSRFTKSNRWSTFPSVALAWRVSQEKFMEKTSSWLDDLKIRATWGQNGASTGLGLYPSYTTIAMDGVVLNNTYIQTAKLDKIGNQELGWERTEMFNVGMDFKLLSNRLSITGEYYIKTTNEILIGLPVPLEYGFGKPNVNIGKMKNNGWEVVVGWNDEINGFRYGISANLSDNDNEVLDLAGTGPWKDGYTDEGLPFKSIYGYESLGLFQTDEEVKNAPFQNAKTGKGDIRYKDQNGDNKITADDRIVIGDPYAHFLYGVNLNASYKNFDISMLFQGVGKKDKIMNDDSVRPLKQSIYEHQLDYWSENNTDAKYPRILNKEDADHNYQVSDFWKINAGYLRMKNLQIGYSLPKKCLTNIGFSNVRAYLSADNLFTISNFVPGWDPEVSKALTYPFSRTFSFGLNVQF
ncbi:SusC/RagA family TonB-linked outer membrane protein [Bacteroides neonati]|uniref:SusC/RagA family TonB-linked outer membrane protein n=1 Tax=Bacteroides neonati TaxID=1347393 RepID=UPI0004BB158F|nr:TonB-dependent receptor [Bacteroides neonati]